MYSNSSSTSVQIDSWAKVSGMAASAASTTDSDDLLEQQPQSNCFVNFNALGCIYYFIGRYMKLFYDMVRLHFKWISFYQKEKEIAKP